MGNWMFASGGRGMGGRDLATGVTANGTFQSFMALGAGGFGIAAGDFNLDGQPRSRGWRGLRGFAEPYRPQRHTTLVSSHQNPVPA